MLQIDPIPLVVDALWTSRKIAEQNPELVQNVLRAYVRAIATLVKDRKKSVDVLGKYMRASDPHVVQNAYERYRRS